MAAKSSKSTSTARRKARAASAARADKSLDQFRSALERSVTLSRERIEEVMDDAVKRGRMTRDDANELVSHLIERGRKQTDDLMSEIESALKQFRDDLQDRAGRARDRAQEVLSRRQAGKRATASKPKKSATGARKQPAAGGSNPIANYESLSAADVRKRLTRLSDSELRAVRAAEKKGKGRKTVLGEIDKRLAK